MKVLLVDDHPLIHEVMSAVLERALSPVSIVSSRNLSDALSPSNASADLVLLDLGLPGYSGIEALSTFRRAFPKLCVVVLSAKEDSATIHATIRSGARGYLPKTTPTQTMVSALRFIVSGGTYIPQEALQADPDSEPPEPATPPAPIETKLTDRQYDVLRQIVRGLPNRQIARVLNISENTVKHHARAIFHTLGVSNRLGALIAASRIGIKGD